MTLFNLSKNIILGNYFIQKIGIQNIIGNTSIIFIGLAAHTITRCLMNQVCGQLIQIVANLNDFTDAIILQDGEIASDLTKYLYVSEQTPASVALGVLVDKDGEVTASGGYFIQAMPGCEDEVLEKLEHNVNFMPYVTQLLEIGFSTEKMIEIIGRDLDVDIKESVPVEFKCRCSRERIESALLSLDKASLEEMSQDEVTEAHCQFCNTTYKFTADEIKNLLAGK